MTTILKIQAPRNGTPVRFTLDGKTWTGEFAGVLDRTFGRVRVGHRIRFPALCDIIEIQAPAGGER